MAELVHVTGRFLEPDGTPGGPGLMSWTLVPGDIPDLETPAVILAGPVFAVIGADGTFAVDVYATDDADLDAMVVGGTLVYRVERTWAERPGAHWQTVTVPGPGPWDWADLVALAAPP